MSSNKSSALLVVTTLILTTTYQAALSPPGSVFQAEAQPKDNITPAGMDIHSGTSMGPVDKLLKRGPSNVGASVLGTTPFLWFFIPNIAAFCISFILTRFVRISILPNFFWFTLLVALPMLLFWLLASSALVISPNSGSAAIMYQYVYILAYILVPLMYLIILITVL
ncbi:hypothetical protein CXB51_025078 [Gossypium anomalum]|uniref:PGG domain-containing protein n=1 Tax=Gossypium anomalum TaxID=47600 RepID=A0A8J6CS40_9ROSI|nr:hypothetical protein CXB51_025078 [Gossypium anomalum]